MQNFLKSLIFPLQMRKYRHMSILISIIILLLTVYILQFPYQVATNQSKSQMIEDNELQVQSLYYLDDETFDYETIRSMNYVIKEMKLHSNIDKNEGRVTYSFSYEHHGVNYITHFIMDPNETVEKEVKAIQDYYLEKFNIKNPNQDEQNKMVTVANIYYIESLKDESIDQDARLTELYEMKYKDLSDMVNEYSFFDLYNVEKSEETHDTIVVFRASTMRYFWDAVQKSDQDKPDLGGSEFTYDNDRVLDFSKEESLSGLGKALTNYIIQSYIKTLQSKQAINLFFSVVVFPPLLVAIIWMFFRKQGALTRFKEYYNMFAISSIIPTVVIFGVCFVWPGVLTFFPALLLIYYLFMVYRINSTPIDVN